jgi:hypothetical protein
MRVGVSFGSNSNKPCGPNAYGEFEDYLVIITPDVTKPIITLVGNNPDSVEIDLTNAYVDPGYTANDNIDGNITPNVVVTGSVNRAVTGTYTLTYNVMDAAGNKAQTVTRTVVVGPDKSAPIITLSGSNPMYVEVYNTFTDPGYSANDNIDGNVTPNVVVTGSVNTSVLGTYTLTYDVSDAAGNLATTVTRTVVVGDATAPVISLNGSNPIDVEVYSVYNDPGASVTDNYWTGLTAVSSMISTSVVGTYTQTYDAVDGSGNVAATVTRTVNIVDTQNPVLTLLGYDTIIVDVKTGSFTDPGYVVYDNYYQGLVATITGTFDVNTLGDYSITYTVADGSGNTTTKTRVIRVVDRQAPVITLVGNQVLVVAPGSTFTDPGVTIADNYYTNAQLQPLLTKTGTVSTALQGKYFVLTYQVTDPSGNVSTTVTRTVYVDWNSVTQLESNVKVEVYPNPTSGPTNVVVEMPASEQMQSIRVMDMSGKLISEQNVTNVKGGRFELNLQGQAQGMYMVAIVTNNQTIIRKVMLAY